MQNSEMTTADLRLAAMAAADRAETLLDRARDNGHRLTETDQRDFDTALAEFKRLCAELKALEVIERRKAIADLSCAAGEAGDRAAAILARARDKDHRLSKSDQRDLDSSIAASNSLCLQAAALEATA
jgi:hypothetical protein